MVGLAQKWGLPHSGPEVRILFKNLKINQMIMDLGQIWTGRTFSPKNFIPWVKLGVTSGTLGCYFENQMEISQSFKKLNFHAIALIFGLLVAGCELLTDFV